MFINVFLNKSLEVNKNLREHSQKLVEGGGDDEKLEGCLKISRC